MEERLIMGRHSYGNIKIIGKEAGQVRVGNFCSFGSGIQVIFVGHHITWGTTFPFSSREKRGCFPNAKYITGHPVFYGDLVIENDVWLGNNVLLLGGTHLASGCVVAAGSVVPGMSFFPYSIIGGNPAKLIGYRFPYNVIQELMSIQWWNWTDEKINHCVQFLCSDLSNPENLKKLVEVSNESFQGTGILEDNAGIGNTFTSEDLCGAGCA